MRAYGVYESSNKTRSAPSIWFLLTSTAGSPNVIRTVFGERRVIAEQMPPALGVLLQSHAVGVIRDGPCPIREDAADADFSGQHIEERQTYRPHA